MRSKRTIRRKNQAAEIKGSKAEETNSRKMQVGHRKVTGLSRLVIKDSREEANPRATGRPVREGRSRKGNPHRRDNRKITGHKGTGRSKIRIQTSLSDREDSHRNKIRQGRINRKATGHNGLQVKEVKSHRVSRGHNSHARIGPLVQTGQTVTVVTGPKGLHREGIILLRAMQQAINSSEYFFY